MIVFYVLGLVLLSGAFLAGAAELAAIASLEETRVFLSAYDTWAILWPDGFLAFRRLLEALHPALWNPAALTLLKLPGWCILGGPGAVLFWIGRPQPDPDDIDGPDEESLFLYDALARRAREEGFDPDHEEPHGHDFDLDGEDHEGDDMAPSHFDGVDRAPDDVDLDHAEDDRAPDYRDDLEPPQLDAEGTWDDVEEPEEPKEPERPQGEGRAGQPVPDPPPVGEGQWIAPPPAVDSGKREE